VPFPAPLFVTVNETVSCPVPVSAAKSWPPLMSSDADLGPRPAGANETDKLHESPAASVRWLQPSPLIANSVGFAPTRAVPIAALLPFPAFDTTNVCVALVWPTEVFG
jgi:hypothetical protein